MIPQRRLVCIGTFNPGCLDPYNKWVWEIEPYTTAHRTPDPNVTELVVTDYAIQVGMEIVRHDYCIGPRTMITRGEAAPMPHYPFKQASLPEAWSEQDAALLRGFPIPPHRF